VRKISPPPKIFLLFSCTLLVLRPYVFLCLDSSAFCLLSLLITHDTNIHTPCWIRTRNPSNRSAADPIRSPDPPARSKSLYRLSYRGPPRFPLLTNKKAIQCVRRGAPKLYFSESLRVRGNCLKGRIVILQNSWISNGNTERKLLWTWHTLNRFWC
jgi:hypothetical protein